MRKIGRIYEKLGMRMRLLLSFGTVLLVIMVGATFSLNYYNQRFIRDLMEQSNTQVMKEINYQLNGVHDKVNQIFISFNSQNLYEMFQRKEELGYFEQVKKQLEYERIVKETVNANNMQGVILGNVFYLNEEFRSYIGTGTMASYVSFQDTEWLRRFREGGNQKMIYGPLIEDFRPKNSQKYEAIYLMRAWNVPTNYPLRTKEIPFVLFSINMGDIREIFARYSKITKGFYVTNKNGEELFHANLKDTQLEQVRAILQQEESVLEGRGTYFNKESFVAEMTNESFGWRIYSVESTKDAFQDMNRLIRNINLIIFVAGGIAIVLTVFFTSKIMMPITLLNKLIRTIEEENDTFIVVQTEDELGQIGNRFNQMKRTLQDMSAKMYLSKVQEKEAQLSALQSQINPHFLYNTLDNIYCIAQIEEIDTITQLTEHLSIMLRYSMDMKRRKVPIQKEIAHMQSYVNVINVRFDNAIELVVNIEKELEEKLDEVKILKLSLQPLVENAWNHGILPKPEHRGRIQITVSIQGNDLLLVVEDDGVGITKERSDEINHILGSLNEEMLPSQKGFGIALTNVNNRIKLEYGEESGIYIQEVEEKKGCRVIMCLKDIHI